MSNLIALEPAGRPARTGVLEGAVSEAELAKQIPCCVRTLADMRRSGDHPPYFKFAGHVYYRVDAVRAWFEAKEKRPVRGHGANVRTPRRKAVK